MYGVSGGSRIVFCTHTYRPSDLLLSVLSTKHTRTLTNTISRVLVERDTDDIGSVRDTRTTSVDQPSISTVDADYSVSTMDEFIQDLSLPNHLVQTLTRDAKHAHDSSDAYAHAYTPE